MDNWLYIVFLWKLKRHAAGSSDTVAVDKNLREKIFHQYDSDRTSKISHRSMIQSKRLTHIYFSCIQMAGLVLCFLYVV